MENNWQDKLRESLENYEKTTPEGLWEEVSLSVESKWKSRSRKNIIWLLSSISAAACALFVMIVSREHVPAVATDDLRALVEGPSIADELASNDVLEKKEQAHNVAIKRNIVLENPVDDIKEADSYLTDTLENYLISIDSETVSDDNGVLESADEKVNGLMRLKNQVVLPESCQWGFFPQIRWAQGGVMKDMMVFMVLMPL